MVRLSVIIPTRLPALPIDNVTLRTLDKQYWREFQIVIVPDVNQRGAGWARNVGFATLGQGFPLTEYVLFSDDDIEWDYRALGFMVDILDRHKDAAYTYCSYKVGHLLIGHQQFDANWLKRTNYISTMSVIRSVLFPGFDETLKRFQDWELWIRMLRSGYKGVYCGATLFQTVRKPGITYNGPVDCTEAEFAVLKKHGDWINS